MHETMIPYAPYHHQQRIMSEDPKKNTSGTRRVIFPRLILPTVSPIEGCSSSHDAELMSTSTPQKPSVILETCDHVSETSGSVLNGPKPLQSSGNESDSTPYDSCHAVALPKSFSVAATPPRGIGVSQRSVLGRYVHQTMPSQFFVDTPLPTLVRVASAPQTPLVSILRESSYEGQTHQDDVQRESRIPKGGPFLPQGHDLHHVSPIRRSQSEPNNRSSERSDVKIHFNPRIWIREFERTPEEHAKTWFSHHDMNRFKRHALALIVAKDRQTATRLLKESSSRAVFTHEALKEESAPHDLVSALKDDRYRTMIAQQEMKRILIVDPHDICLRLFERAFTTLLPNVEVIGVASSNEAMAELARHRFDVILVEERLERTFHLQRRQQSGSDFFRSLSSSMIAKQSLWIGVSAHLPKDRAALEASGVDLCWNKPPPKMSIDLRNDLLRRLLSKRGQDEFARELFGIQP